MPLRNRLTKRPRRFVETIRELNSLGLVKGPDAVAASNKTDDEIATWENGAGFIPKQYRPDDVSEKLAAQVYALTREASARGLSLSAIWGTAKTPGILVKLIKSQGEWSSKNTRYLRIQIVERAREELWRMTSQNYRGLFICSLIVNILFLIYIALSLKGSGRLIAKY